MKTKRFSHIDALRPGSSRPHQEFSFIAKPPPYSAGAEVGAEQPDLIGQLTPDSETRTEWRRLCRPEHTGLGTMIEPDKRPVDQRQRLIANPPRLRLAPIR